MEIRSKGHAKVVQAICFSDDGDLYVQYGYAGKQTIERFMKKDGKYTRIKTKNYKSLGHANGLTVKGNNLYSVRGHSRKVTVINRDTLDVIQVRNAPVKTVGAIGFNGKEWCFSCGKYLCYGTFSKITKRIEKKKPRKYQQDLCYWKEYTFNCISVGKKKNRIVIYKNGKVWNILENVHNGFELEGCAVNKDGELFVLLNRRHKVNDKIVKVKWNVA